MCMLMRMLPINIPVVWKGDLWDKSVPSLNSFKGEIVFRPEKEEECVGIYFSFILERGKEELV